MLQSAAMLFWLAIVWLLATGRWHTPLDWALAFSAALACTIVAMRFGGAPRASAAWPRNVRWILARFRDASRIIKAVLGSRRALQPALVHISAQELAAGGDLLAGGAVVDSDAKGLLVHVLIEDDLTGARR
ncbi:MAG: hypothetical protein JNM59_11450 [Hyphomonadaceae bacterium]|nr:hypothetical protein [Hyphomonadaceae bacterium]